MKRILLGTILSLFLIFNEDSFAQERIEKITFGDFNSWIVRIVSESGIIGGANKTLYEIAKGDTLKDNAIYKNMAGSPWANSNVMAKVAGVVKSSSSVSPEKRGNGYCARLETILESCKVLGLVNITVVASGSIFLGEVKEPIKDAKNPYEKLLVGRPYTQKPKALSFDYKLKLEKSLTKATGMGRPTKVAGINSAEVSFLLQKRWEDANGNIFAKRVGTAWEKLSDNTPDWINGYRMNVHYGDITSTPYYKPYMALINSDQINSINSKGNQVLVKEVGWAEPGEKPTHIVLRFASSDGRAYTGGVGSLFWLDNVRLIH